MTNIRSRTPPTPAIRGSEPELVAPGPGQVYSWDITKLDGPLKGNYFDAYVILDIYSRLTVGSVLPRESAALAEDLMTPPARHTASTATNSTCMPTKDRR